MKKHVIGLGVAGMCAAAVWSCDPDQDVKPGAPVVLGVNIVNPVTGAEMPAVIDADAGVPMVSPLVNFRARFDRIIDPTTVETVTATGTMGVPGVATLTGPPGVGAFTAEVSYNPGGSDKYFLLLPTGPTVTAMPMPTLPSGSQVTLTWNKMAFRSRDGKDLAVWSAGVPDTFTFMTDPFGASITFPEPMMEEMGMDAGDDSGAPDGGAGMDDAAAMADASMMADAGLTPDAGITDAGDLGDAEAPDATVAPTDTMVAIADAGTTPVDAAAPETDGGAMAMPTNVTPDFALVVAFNNKPAADILDHVTVTAVDAANMPIAATKALDDTGMAVAITPPGEAGWPEGAMITVVVDANAADALGVKIAMPMTWQLKVVAQ